MLTWLRARRGLVLLINCAAGRLGRLVAPADELFREPYHPYAVACFPSPYLIPGQAVDRAGW